MADPVPDPLPSRHASLRVSGIAVPARLGWSAAERATPQQAIVDVALRFQSLPGACRSDRLDDTVDYGPLVQRVVETAAAAEYRLLEHLAAALIAALRAMLPDGIGLAVRVTKQPPIASIQGGASFRIGDWPESGDA